MRSTLIQAVTLTLLTALLAGCGFQLRGTGSNAVSVPDDWKLMYLATGNPNSELSRAVVSQFAANGVQWTERDAANFVLVLGGEEFRQRNLSLTAEARAAEFELTMRTHFTVRQVNNAEVIPQTNASVVKQMENDPRNVVGKAEEVRLLKNEMRTELVRQIMRRIGFFAAGSQASGAQTAAPQDAASQDPASQDPASQDTGG